MDRKCIKCGTVLSTKVGQKYCTDCRPQILKNQLNYYQRKKNKKQYKCIDCSTPVCGENRRCNPCRAKRMRSDKYKWLGKGRTIDTAGYIRIKINGHFIPEHRYLWEQIYGKLPFTWQVHHLDGVKTNNAMDNLYACSISYHHSSKFVSILQDRIKSLENTIKLLKSHPQLDLFVK